MPADRTPAPTRTEKVALTDFQNDPGPYLDRGRRAPVTITKYGHPDLTIDDAAYFERIERFTAGQIQAILDLQTVLAADMTAEHAALFQATRPTAQERASDRWNDDAAP